MADIKAIKDKLASLLARARDAGSSEAEVAACLNKAQKLMADYGVTEEDLDNATEESFRSYQWDIAEGRKAHDPVVRYCAGYIGRLTGVVFYLDNTLNKGKTAPIIAFGMDADVEYALWLIKSLRLFMDDQWQYYRDWELGNCDRYTLKAERIGFVRGFCARINERIKEMQHRDQEQGGVGTGTDLVVKKSELVHRTLEERLGHRLGRGKSLAGRGKASNAAMGAGYQAGNTASLGRGVGKSAIAIGKG